MEIFRYFIKTCLYIGIPSILFIKPEYLLKDNSYTLHNYNRFFLKVAREEVYNFNKVESELDYVNNNDIQDIIYSYSIGDFSTRRKDPFESKKPPMSFRGTKSPIRVKSSKKGKKKSR